MRKPGDMLELLAQEFDSEFYLQEYPEVGESGIEPL